MATGPMFRNRADGGSILNAQLPPVSAPEPAKSPRSAPQIVTLGEMSEPESFSFLSGSAVGFSKRCPSLHGPNEDAALVHSLSAYEGVLAVCDGLGGMAGGADASRMTVRALSTAIEPGPGLAGRILEGIDTANRTIMDRAFGAGTTIVAAEFREGHVRPYHVGDSHLMVIAADGGLRHITCAHSPVGYAIQAGVLDDEAALYHEDRHLVSNMVGVPSMSIEVGPRIPLDAGDYVLLGSDGLFDNLRIEEIIELVRRDSLVDAVGSLAAGCSLRMACEDEASPSKPDDHTFLLYRA